MLIARVPSFIFTLFILYPVMAAFGLSFVGIHVPAYSIISIAAIFLIVSTLRSMKAVIRIPRIHLFLFFLFSWILFSNTYTPSTVASFSKSIAIIYNTVMPICLILFAVSFQGVGRIDIVWVQKHMLKMAYLLLWVTVISLLIFGEVGVGGRYSLPGVENPIWVSRYVGMLMLIILCFDKFQKRPLLYCATLTVGILALLMCGSRAPVIAVILTYILSLFSRVSKTKVIGVVIMIGLAVCAGFALGDSYLFDTKFYSVYERFELFKLLSSLNFNYALGAGIGSFGWIAYGEDFLFYPHNIFAEIAFEFGVIGILLFLLVMYEFFSNFTPNIINLLCLYFFIGSLTSGDIPGNNNLFLLLFVSGVAYVQLKGPVNKISFAELAPVVSSRPMGSTLQMKVY